MVQWLWKEIHVTKVKSFNTNTIYWMDIFYIPICCKICNVCLPCLALFEKTKINEKEARVDTLTKN